LAATLLAVGCQSIRPTAEHPHPKTDRAQAAAIANKMESHLRSQVLAKWFPACVDSDKGGFHQDFRADWTRGPVNERMLVYQARQTWVASQVALNFPDLADSYVAYARHGVRFLKDRMWDQKHGGFLWRVNPDGQPIGKLADEKHAYGLSFAIYALADAYCATDEREALDLALATFRWIDKQGHDDKHGGYHEAFALDGTPLLTSPDPDDPKRRTSHIAGLYGARSMNTHIHLLESFTALAGVTRERLVHRRLRELHEIVRDRIAVEPGALNLWFTADWRPMPDHDSFGHDLEAAYLLIESAERLGMPHDPRTRRIARMIVDHALDVGWDTEHGGFFDSGGINHAKFLRRKIWWVQAEGLNALLLMHELHGHETSRYWDAFVRQWRFIQQHQTDQTHGGWRASVAEDGAPDKLDAKSWSQGWKAAYHNGRALMNCIERLE